jgi:hypothetical protein
MSKHRYSYKLEKTAPMGAGDSGQAMRHDVLSTNATQVVVVGTVIVFAATGFLARRKADMRQGQGLSMRPCGRKCVTMLLITLMY